MMFQSVLNMSLLVLINMLDVFRRTFTVGNVKCMKITFPEGSENITATV